MLKGRKEEYYREMGEREGEREGVIESKIHVVHLLS